MRTTLNSPAKSSQEKLKIAVLIRDFVPTGGAERYALEVTRRLAQKHDVHVFAQEWSFQGDEKITFHKIPKFLTRPSFLNQLLFSYFTRKSLDDSFDVIHTHERVTHFDVLTIHAPCFRSLVTRQNSWWKRLFIWFSVGLSPRKLAYLWLEKKQFTYNEERLLIAVSENVKKNVQTNYDLPDEYFRLAYPGVDRGMAIKRGSEGNLQELRSKLGIAQNDLIILFVGTEFKRKGLDALLKGFALMPRSSIKLVIAGGGGGKLENYITLAEELGIEKHVIFLGLVSNVEELYAISDVYILPTLSDPCPMAPIEAMLAGVATIMSCSQYAGTAEHIKSGEALILEDPKDPDEIANSLRKLMDEGYRRELSEKGRQLAEELTWERTTEDTLSTYYEVLERKESKPK
jgi:glycosyltransferase involved in cell wall biosynthesis